jgi:hypothetical protein
LIIGFNVMFKTRQHGLPPFRIADLARDADVLDETRRDATDETKWQRAIRCLPLGKPPAFSLASSSASTSAKSVSQHAAATVVVIRGR